MDDDYTLTALKVLRSYFEEADMSVEIIREEETGSYYLVQSIELDENEQIGISYTINPESDNMDDTVVVRFTAPFNIQIPQDKINDVLLHLNTLNMHNTIGHYYLLGDLPIQVYEYAVPGRTLGEAENFLDVMFLFGYSLIAANDSVVKMIEENIPPEQAYVEFVGEYSYFLLEKLEETEEEDGEELFNGEGNDDGDRE